MLSLIDSEWIIVLQHDSSSGFDWNRGWNDYRNGFGSTDSDFWLGLETIHRLTTNATYRLRIELHFKNSGNWQFAEYSTFIVGDETKSLYRLLTLNG